MGEVRVEEQQRPTLLVVGHARERAFPVDVAAEQAHPGLEVVTAFDSVEGVALLAESAPFAKSPSRPRFDLVLVDASEPEAEGLEVLRWIQARPGRPPVDVVVLTRAPEPDEEARARALGAVAVHPKPADPEALRLLVEAIVSRWIGRGAIISAYLSSMG